VIGLYYGLSDIAIVDDLEWPTTSFQSFSLSNKTTSLFSRNVTPHFQTNEYKFILFLKITLTDIGRQWRNFDIFIYARCLLFWPPWCMARKCKHFAAFADRWDGASTKLFSNLSIQFYWNNVTNLHQLTSQSTTICLTAHRS